jgi:type I restriction enzyme S subunit
MPEQKKAVVPRLRFPEFRDAGPWEVKRLGELAEIYQPETIPLSSLSNNGEFLVYGANGIIGRFDCYNHEQPQIAVTCRGSTCGEVTLTRPRSWITGNSMVVNVDNSPGVIKGFLYFQLKGTNWNYLITGSGQPQITGEIKKHKVALPSLDEQQKIADCLSSLDELIELEAKQLEALQAHKKGLMQQLFPREGENTPRLCFPEFRDAGPWEVKRLGDVYRFIPTNSFSREQLTYESGTIKNIHYGDIHTKYRALFDVEREHVPFLIGNGVTEDFDDERFCVPGDVILADASEDLDDIGKAIEIVNIGSHKVVAGLHTLHARQLAEDLVIGFGGCLFQCNAIREQIRKQAQGAKVLGISATRLKSIKLAAPRKPEQQKIADCLSSLDELIELQAKQLEALQTHKKGLMQQLFPQEIDL